MAEISGKCTAATVTAKQRNDERIAMTAATVGANRTRRLRADRARQVADVLRQQVVRGDFADGSLPHEHLLMAEFDSSATRFARHWTSCARKG